LDLYADQGLTPGVAYTPTERISILGTGNIGIGTTTPQAKLEIGNAGTYSFLAGSQRIGNVAAPFLGTDAVNKNYIDGLSHWVRADGVVSLTSSADQVGIGTTTVNGYKLKVDGNVGITGVLQTQTGSDFAEEFAVQDNIEAGTVVVIGDLGYKSVKAASVAYDKRVVGVVSDNPSIIAGRVDSEKKVVVAMAGVVKVKVVSAGGQIQKGDLLTSSEIEGYAMKANDAKSGTIIGKALEDLNSRRGEIKVLINLQ